MSGAHDGPVATPSLASFTHLLCRTGANLEVDVSIQYLRFFLEDDAELQEIEQRYKNGDLLTGEVKARLIEVLSSSISQT